MPKVNNKDLLIPPPGLRAREQWVTWEFKRRGGKATKVPTVPGSGRFASSTDPSTWRSYSQALKHASEGDGIGFVVTKADPYCGLDLDHCRNGTGLWHPSALGIVEAMRSWTYITPSGEGLRVFIEAPMNGHPHHKFQMDWGDQMEVYDDERFFVIGGAPFPGYTRPIAKRAEQLDSLLDTVERQGRYRTRGKAARPVSGHVTHDSGGESEAEAEPRHDYFVRLAGALWAMNWPKERVIAELERRNRLSEKPIPESRVVGERELARIAEWWFDHGDAVTAEFWNATPILQHILRSSQIAAVAPLAALGCVGVPPV